MQIRRKALVLLNERVQGLTAAERATLAAHFVGMVDQLRGFLERAHDQPDEVCARALPRADPAVTSLPDMDSFCRRVRTCQAAVTQRAALISLQILMSHFAKADPAPFLQLLPQLVACAQSADPTVAAAGLVCLASAWSGSGACTLP